MPKVVPRQHRLRLTLGAEDDSIINLVLKKNSRGEIKFPCMVCRSPVDLSGFFKQRGTPTHVRINCSGKDEKHPYTIRFTLG